MKLEFDVPESALAGLSREQSEICDYLRLVAAVKLHEMGQLTADRAAELAGIDQSDFVRRVSQLGTVAAQEAVESDVNSIREALREAETEFESGKGLTEKQFYEKLSR